MTQKPNLTKLAFKLHGWLGLTAGIFFLLYGLTGSVLMFRGALDRYFNPDLHHLTPASHKVSADSIYRMINSTHPNLKKIVLHDFPVDEHDSYEFMLFKNQQSVTENYLYFVFVNPYTGKILKEGSYQQITPSFLRWLYSLHYSLQLGFPGKLFTAIIGLVMLLSLLTGIIIYRKNFLNVLLFKTRLNFKNKRTTTSSIHRIIGVWATLFTAVLFFTGFWMNREHFLPSEWALYKPHKNYLVTANIDSMLKQTQRIVPGFLPIAVNVPCVKGQDVLVRGRMPSTTFFLLQGKASALTFDAATGKFKSIYDIDKQSFDKRFNAEVYQMHVGAYGGSIVRWLYFILGLLPGVLSVTGAVLWIRKNKYKLL